MKITVPLTNFFFRFREQSLNQLFFRFKEDIGEIAKLREETGRN